MPASKLWKGCRRAESAAPEMQVLVVFCVQPRDNGGHYLSVNLCDLNPIFSERWILLSPAFKSSEFQSSPAEAGVHHFDQFFFFRKLQTSKLGVFGHSWYFFQMVEFRGHS